MMNKKKMPLVILFVSIVSVFTGCGISNKKVETLSVEEMVSNQMKEMNLDEKIAQMLIVYYNGTTFDDSLKSSLENTLPGGFILQGVNITNYKDTLEYVKKIKATATIPMFIAIDQEGGIVQRLRNLEEATVIPSMLEVGKTDDPNLAYEIGALMAREVRTLGINLVFAPVIDIFTNEENTVIGKRAFGTTKEEVIKMAFPLAKALSDNGMIPVFKHFPGHGDTTADSHYSLPIVNKTLEELYEEELVPFKEAISIKAPMIMAAHIAYPKITGDDIPATLSYKMITEVLREEMGYKGIIITDALNMKALTDDYTDYEIYEKAINAGVDILLMPNGSSKTISQIKEAVIKGKIKEERIDESVRRILTLKYERLEDDNYLDYSMLGKEEHKEIVSKVIEQVEE